MAAEPPRAEEEATTSAGHTTQQMGEHPPTPTRLSVETIAAQALLALPVDEEFATPATQQELAPEEIDALIDPQLGEMNEPVVSNQVSGINQNEPSFYPLDTIEGEQLGMQNADIWLSGMFDEQDNGLMPDMAVTASSPLTSVASEPDTAGGRIFRGCKCAAHQHIYDDWPMHDAELTIAKCMTVCMYCGVDYHRPPTLRMHLRSAKKHAQNNISVVRETMGRGSSDTLSWTPKPRVEITNDVRVTRRQAATNSAKVTSRR